MPSAKAILGGVLAPLLLPLVTITANRSLGPCFRLLELEGHLPSTPGDKLQVFLPGVGTRTYTPLSHSPNPERTHLLVYLHGTTPGATWAREARPGDGFRALGPRRSIALPDLGRSLVVFGDETSFALAQQAARVAGSRAVLEVSSLEASRPVLAELGLEAADVIERTDDDGHLDAVTHALASALRDAPTASLVLTGRGRSIQRVRAGLRAAGLDRRGKTKAYWADGKSGLDLGSGVR